VLAWTLLAARDYASNRQRTHADDYIQSASMIAPIPKGHNVNKSDSANFIGIALSSIFGKIQDNIILDRYHVQLMSCDRQFGFKPKSSINLCSMVLKETVTYYVQIKILCFVHS